MVVQLETLVKINGHPTEKTYKIMEIQLEKLIEINGRPTGKPTYQ